MASLTAIYDEDGDEWVLQAKSPANPLKNYLANKKGVTYIVLPWWTLLTGEPPMSVPDPPEPTDPAYIAGVRMRDCVMLLRSARGSR